MQQTMHLNMYCLAVLPFNFTDHLPALVLQKELCEVLSLILYSSLCLGFYLLFL